MQALLPDPSNERGSVCGSFDVQTYYWEIGVTDLWTWATQVGIYLYMAMVFPSVKEGGLPYDLQHLFNPI